MDRRTTDGRRDDQTCLSPINNNRVGKFFCTSNTWYTLQLRIIYWRRKYFLCNPSTPSLSLISSTLFRNRWSFRDSKCTKFAEYRYLPSRSEYRYRRGGREMAVVRFDDPNNSRAARSLARGTSGTFGRAALGNRCVIAALSVTSNIDRSIRLTSASGVSSPSRLRPEVPDDHSAVRRRSRNDVAHLVRRAAPFCTSQRRPTYTFSIFHPRLFLFLWCAFVACPGCRKYEWDRWRGRERIEIGRSHPTCGHHRPQITQSP